MVNKYFYLSFTDMKTLCIFIFSVLYFTACNPGDTGPIIHTFEYHSTEAQKVSVAGSFNNWNSEDVPMISDGTGGWKAEIKLQPGYYQYKLVVDGKWIPDPENSWKINDGGDSFNSIIKIGEPPVPQRVKSSRPFPKDKLPEPVLDSEPDLIDIYYAAWRMAWNKIKQGTKENGFAPYYMDEGFNELIYQWDTCFITAFAMYGLNVFPVMASLDNFYSRQRSDGYIQRVYWETTGKMANEPTADEPMVNPPLFAWIEWRYYRISGDSSRLEHVLPVLTKYFDWTEKNCRTVKGKGLFYTSPLGSGMDNTPRKNVGKAAWIDYSSQQALAALYISKIAEAAGENNIQTAYGKKYDEIRDKINSLLWDKKTGFYYDLTESDSLSRTMHVGAYWTLLSGVCPEENLHSMLSHLRNPEEFYRPHLVPTLAANQPEYDKKGHYWLGSVWAPTDYMVIKGLMNYGAIGLADTIAFNFLHQIADVYFNFKPLEDKIAFEERYDDGYHTLWECYSPEYDTPATRWDNTFYSRQDFVGWTGLGPIAMLIENVLGFEINGRDNLIKWNIKRNDKHGLKNIQLRHQKVSLICEPSDRNLKINIKCEKPFRLIITHTDKDYSYNIQSGESVIEVKE